MRTRSKLSAACCGLAMVAAACGGGSERLSAADYARVASAACARANRVIERIDVPPLANAEHAARAMARVVAVERDAIDELRELRPPEELADTTQTWIALLDQGADELERMAARLRVGDRAEASAYGAKATILLDRARELVARLRVTSCRGPELPTV